MKIGELTGKEDDSAGKPLAAQASRPEFRHPEPMLRAG